MCSKWSEPVYFFGNRKPIVQGELISVAPNPAKESVSFTLEFPIVTDLPPRGDRHPQAGG
ncbi:MAG: hypothetical protein IKG88_00280 [Bacteroidales bacterium]|nr:hypothetical protein [Bacteroidales bacterium]MBR3434303.1 hypothetical protein [Bacteroidales bacterium]